MLALANLRVSYDGVPALNDVSLKVDAGQIVALVGGNGNGKSTTLRAAAGLNALDAGSITFEGRAVHGLPAHERVPLGLSLVPEGRRLFPRLSVRRNLELGAFTRNDKDGIAADVDRMFGLFPDPEMASSTSPGEARFFSCSMKIRSYPSSLAQAMMPAVLSVRERTRSRFWLSKSRSVHLLRSSQRCEALAPEPPLPMMNTNLPAW